MPHYKPKGVKSADVENPYSYMENDYVHKMPKAYKDRLIAEKAPRDIHSTIPVAMAHKACSMPQAFDSPNPPDVRRMSKGMPIVGLV